MRIKVFGYLIRITACVTLFALSVAAQTSAILDRGLKGQAYLSDTIDSVNLFNGNLTLQVPIGQTYHVGGDLDYRLVLFYNSSVWKLKSVPQNQGPQSQLVNTIQSTPNPDENAGMGWHLDFGHLYGPNQPGVNEDNPSWTYVGPDGARHNFRDTLIDGDPVVSNLKFTRDATYLRLNFLQREIEFPNGQIHRFSVNGELVQMRDRFNNRVDVNTTSTTQWVVSDTCGSCASPTRQHTIYFNAAHQISRVDLAAFNGTASYIFTYDDNVSLPRHRNTYQWPVDQTNAVVSLLRRVDFPANAGAYTFDYYRSDDFSTGAVSGIVQTTTLPSGGAYVWRYQDYAYDQSDPTCNPVDPKCNFLDAPESLTDGLREKLIYNDSTLSAQAYLGNYLYQQNPGAVTQGETRATSKTIVTSPTNDDTVYYFNVGYQDWGYGMPFDSLTSNGAFFLSRDYYQGRISDNNKVRSVYVRYEADTADPTTFVQDTNRRLAGTRTIYDDGIIADETSTDYNGLGHYETVTTDGTFSGSFGGGDVRTTATHYDYGPNDPARPSRPGTSDPWILNTVRYQIVTENNSSAKMQFCYSLATGFLQRKRTFAAGINVNATDLIMQYTPDDYGNVKTEEHFGGDKPTRSVPVTNNLCGSALSNAEYTINNEYKYGILSRSYYAGAPYNTVESDVNANTGLYLWTKDSAGVPTYFTYDAMGRITAVSPTGEAATNYSYQPPNNPTGILTVANAARVDITQTAATNSLSSEVLFDRFGRVWREQKRIPDTPNPVWSTRETKYNTVGWKTSVSEYADLTDGETPKTTRFQNYDAFGRAGLILPPDNDNFTEIKYFGVRQVKTSKFVGAAYDAISQKVIESSVDKTETYDRQGRLIKVEEASGVNNDVTPTTYSYDIGNRLSSVSTTASVTGSSQTTPPVNVALRTNGATVTPSSTLNSNFPALSMINGERSGIGWGTGNTNNGGWNDATQNDYGSDWVKVDFDGQRTISSVDVYTVQDNFTNPSQPTPQMTFSQYGIVDFDVQYWNGSAWIAVPNGNIRNNNNVMRHITFPKLTTTSIRVVVLKGLADYSRLVEIEAYGDNNLALNKTATQSSIGAGTNGVASRAVDGNRDGNFFDGSVTHTDYQAQPWWQVDLGSAGNIDFITLWNRTDCACPERLADFYVFVSDQPFVSTDVNTTKAQPGVSSYYTPGGAGPKLTINIARTGRYVRVQLNGTNFLSLAEVEVYGNNDLALLKPASQSSLAAGTNAVASRAVDGNQDGDFTHGSVTHTNLESQPWWQTDLGSSSAIDSITLWNRTDCACPERLENFYVFVSDQPFAFTTVAGTLGQSGVSAYYIPGGAGPKLSINIGRTGQYVRVQLAGTNFLSLAEVGIYGPGGTNVALSVNHATATASSTLSTSYPVASVINGERAGTGWGTGNPNNGGWIDGTAGEFGSDWARVDFSGTKTINEIDVYSLQDNFTSGAIPTDGQTFTQYGLVDFDVQYWNGSKWVLVPSGSIRGNNLVRRKVSFSDLATSAIRVVIFKGATAPPSDFSRIVELEAWTPAVITPPPPSSMVTQTRTFTYDNRGFLTSEREPEKGANGNGFVYYQSYDSLGHVGQIIDGSHVTTMDYDSFGRQIAINEVTGGVVRPLKQFTYGANNNGSDLQLSKLQKAVRHNYVKNPYVPNPTVESDVLISESYNYTQPGGRLSTKTTVLNEKNPPSSISPSFVQNFTYDGLGYLASQTYPSCTNSTCTGSNAAQPRTVSYGYSFGLLASVWNGAVGGDKYGSLTYQHNRTIASVAHGNGVSDLIGRDASDLPRPASIQTSGARVVSGASADWSSGPFSYDNAGNVTQIGTNWYVYDKADRLIEGTTLGIGQKQKYSYDPFGNMLSMDTYANVTTTAPNGNLVNHYVLNYNNAINRWTNLAYDDSGSFEGNARVDGSYPFTYDALNRMETAPGVTYLYGPNDERLWIVDKRYNDDPAIPPPSPAPAIIETYTLRGLNGEVLREYTVTGGDAVGHWAWQRDYIYRGTSLLASENALGGRQHLHLDHLGSPRLVTDQNRYVVESHQYYPFGDDATNQSAADNRLKFTGHERDLLNNGAQLYNMGARFYAQSTARFLSVDPGKDFDPHQPQSWNLYVYVRNNPLKFTDPTGMAAEARAENPEPHATTDGDDASLDEDFAVLDFFGGVPIINLPPLLPLAADVQFTLGPNANPYFAPEVAVALSTTIRQLNNMGIVPQINSGLRTEDDQNRMLAGGSGKNPAAKVSLHQAGYAVDINGTASADFSHVKTAMSINAMKWGGTFKTPDPPHFYNNPFGTPGSATYYRNLQAAVDAAQRYFDSHFAHQ